MMDEGFCGPAIDRLAAYEDTGLEPEEIMGLCEMEKRSRLAKMLRWEEAERAGRLVVLPCKVGDTVWAITSPVNIAGMASDNEELEIFECTVESISLYTASPTQFKLYYRGEFVAWYVTVSDFGKTVFMTQEEAEAALETMKGGSHEADSF